MNRRQPCSTTFRQHARGAVLFVALIFLILLTLLALTATGTSILQEKMTGGMRNRQLGMMGAESALRGGEAYLWDLSFSASTGQPLPPCVSNLDYTGRACVYRPRHGVLDRGMQAFRTSKTWGVAVPGGAPEYAHTLTGLRGAAETASLGAQPLLALEDLGADVGASEGRQSGVIDPELRGGAGTNWLYRITARSQGGNEAVVRSAESVFAATNLTNTGIEP